MFLYFCCCQTWIPLTARHEGLAHDLQNPFSHSIMTPYMTEKQQIRGSPISLKLHLFISLCWFAVNMSKNIHTVRAKKRRSRIESSSFWGKRMSTEFHEFLALTIPTPPSQAIQRCKTRGYVGERRFVEMMPYLKRE